MNSKMTFSDLIDKIAAETGSTKKLVHDLLIEAIALNQESLENDGRNNLPGLGRFSVKWHESRTGRNPQTGETIEIPAHNSVSFKAITSLRNHINRKYAHLEPELLKTIPTIKKAEESVAAKKVEAPPPPVVVPDRITEKKTAVKEIKKKSYKTIWILLFVILILLLFLALFFWPFSGSKQDAVPPNTEITSNPVIETVQKESINQEEASEETKISASEVSVAETKIVRGIPAGKHSVKSGDNLYLLSKNYYQSTLIWPLIYQANRSIIYNPDILQVGKEIDFPALQQIPKNLTDFDKAQLAHGYFEVYLFYINSNREKALEFLWVASKLNHQTLLKNEQQIPQEYLEAIRTFKGDLRY